MPKGVINFSLIEWPIPDLFSEANATDAIIGPNSVLPEPSKPPEYYEGGIDVYSTEYQKKICREAQILGGSDYMILSL